MTAIADSSYEQAYLFPLDDDAVVAEHGLVISADPPEAAPITIVLPAKTGETDKGADKKTDTAAFVASTAGSMAVSLAAEAGRATVPLPVTTPNTFVQAADSLETSVVTSRDQRSATEREQALVAAIEAYNTIHVPAVTRFSASLLAQRQRSEGAAPLIEPEYRAMADVVVARAIWSVDPYGANIPGQVLRQDSQDPVLLSSIAQALAATQVKPGDVTIGLLDELTAAVQRHSIQGLLQRTPQPVTAPAEQPDVPAPSQPKPRTLRAALGTAPKSSTSTTPNSRRPEPDMPSTSKQIARRIPPRRQPIPRQAVRQPVPPQPLRKPAQAARPNVIPAVPGGNRGASYRREQQPAAQPTTYRQPITPNRYGGASVGYRGTSANQPYARQRATTLLQAVRGSNSGKPRGADTFARQAPPSPRMTAIQLQRSTQGRPAAMR